MDSADIDTSMILSSMDVADVLGVVPSAVSNYKRRYADFPRPFMSVARGSVALYWKPEVVAWAERRGVEGRPGVAPAEPTARIVRPSVARMYR